MKYEVTEYYNQVNNLVQTEEIHILSEEHRVKSNQYGFTCGLGKLLVMIFQESACASITCNDKINK